jgi:transposase
MFCLNDSMRYYLCNGATDMRKSWNTLSGLVINQMGKQLQLGDCFIFINRKRDTCKILTAEDGGLVMYMKKLSRGTFHLPVYNPGTSSYNMEWRDLVVMIEGIKENPDKRLKRLKAPRKR